MTPLQKPASPLGFGNQPTMSVADESHNTASNRLVQRINSYPPPSGNFGAEANEWLSDERSIVVSRPKEHEVAGGPLPLNHLHHCIGNKDERAAGNRRPWRLAAECLKRTSNACLKCTAGHPCSCRERLETWYGVFKKFDNDVRQDSPPRSTAAAAPHSPCCSAPHTLSPPITKMNNGFSATERLRMYIVHTHEV